MPKVSVIIPNFNHSLYLNQRIESVLGQTFQDFEVIILDDRSTDNSREIIERYRGHEKISNIIFNEINGGSTFKQWEKGIKLAKGEYIWIAESDDWCETNFLEVLTNGLFNNKNCAIAYSQSYVIGDENNVRSQSRHHRLSETVNGKSYIKQYLLFDNHIFNASMAVFSKEHYLRISKEYTLFKFCGDWLFWSSLATEGDVFISGKLLNYFRKHENDVSGKAYLTGYNYIEEVRLLKILEKNAVINNQEYKDALSSKYLKYCNNKNAFTKARRSEIEKDFYLDLAGNKKYRYFLMNKRIIDLVKSVIKSFIK